ncbi:MAG: OmpA family protein, partial [Pseudomonadota bacterium]
AQQATAETERLRREREAARQATAELEADLAALQAERTQRGLVVTLGNDVLFEVGRAELEPGSARAIERLAEFMREHPERSVLVEGFTDSTGSDAYNLELSRARADAVRAALVSRGIGADRVATVGHGEQYAIASNSNPGGRQLNRRVEVVISDESGRIASR